MNAVDRIKAEVARERTALLDTAWDRINCLGGTFESHDQYGAGYVKAIDEALSIIEALGGRDPHTVPITPANTEAA